MFTTRRVATGRRQPSSPARAGLRRAACALAAGCVVVASAPAAPLELAREIVVAQPLPLTGPRAARADQVRLGASVCFAHVNAGGGIGGTLIRHAVDDDFGDPARAVQLSRELLRTERASALFGMIGTASVGGVAVSGLLDSSGVPLVAPLEGAAANRAPAARGVFHVRASHAQELAALASQLATLNITRVLVAHQAGAGDSDDAALAAAALGGHRIEVDGLVELASTGLAAAVQQLQRRAPEAIVVLADGPTTAELVQRYRQAGGSAHLLATSSADHALVTQVAGAAAARGMTFTQVVPYPYRGTRPVVREYLGMLDRYGPQSARPSYAGLEAYIGAKVLVEALRRAAPDFSGRQVAAALHGLGVLDLGGFTVSLSGGGRAGGRYVDLTVLNQDGKLLK